MPLFRRAEWPKDHRDEVVAGALVGAVVIVLGYASGIGAPSASGTGETAAPPVSPPTATAPAEPPAPAAPADSGPQQPGFPAAPVGEVPTGTGELPVPGGSGGGAHTGHGSSPAPVPDPLPSSPSPSPSPPGSTSPPPRGACEDGEVHLVAPLLSGLTRPVSGLLAGTGGTGGQTPAPQPSPCVGLASPTGLLGITATPPAPEATP